jgi:signal transduction histidine kinase/CheY-like chemotaxis protein
MSTADLTPARSDISARVLLDQVRAAVGNPGKSLTSTVAANLVAAALMVFAMYDRTPTSVLAGWFVLMAMFQLVRARMSQAYWLTAPTNGPALQHWLTKLNALAAASGLLWGCTGWLFFAPDSVIHQALLAVLLCAMAAGSVPANAMLRWGMPGSAIAIFALLIARLGIENDRNHWAMAMMLAVYLLFVLKWGRELHELVMVSLRRKHENHDLVEQLRQKSEQAVEAQTMAEAANLAKSKFLAAASHDLRQPLYALSLFSGVMANEHRPERLHDLAGHIANSVQALESLFNALLDISKLDAGATPVEKSDFPLQGLLSRLSAEYTTLAADKQLTLSIPDTDAHLHTDPQLLEVVLRNLLSNAIRYTQAGQISVVVAQASAGNAWRIDVVDTGVGIPPEEIHKVFGEFYQVHNPERDRSKGLGLGLSIVRRLALLLDMPLELQSQPGEGTTVSVTVPKQTTATASSTTSPAPELQTVEQRFEGLKVLVVDDERAVLMATATILTSWGCDVVCVESQAQAAEHLAHGQWQPDVVLADYRLREGKTGVELLHWLRQNISFQLPCAIITGDIAPEQIRDITGSGYRLLHKPVSPLQLNQLLRELTIG